MTKCTSILLSISCDCNDAAYSSSTVLPSVWRICNTAHFAEPIKSLPNILLTRYCRFLTQHFISTYTIRYMSMQTQSFWALQKYPSNNQMYPYELFALCASMRVRYTFVKNIMDGKIRFTRIWLWKKSINTNYVIAEWWISVMLCAYSQCNTTVWFLLVNEHNVS